MAKQKPGKQELDFYIIRGTNTVVRVGDNVLMRPAKNEKSPYVARVERIEGNSKGNVKVRIRWYYRPEDAIGGRRPFHGIKELFFSDHYDVQNACTIEDKCLVHSLKNYTMLKDDVGAEDYFCRFEYKAATGAFTPDRVAVYCKCQMPFNPDNEMVLCQACKDGFHPACVNMSIEQVKQVDRFMCSDCSNEDLNRAQATNAASSEPVPSVQEAKNPI